MDKLLFDAPDIHICLHLATCQEKDGAGFGIVQLAFDGTVSFYNRCETALSGLSPERVIGRNFFTDVAPCTNNFLVAQRFAEAEDLDECLDYVFTFRMRPTRVKLRLLQSARLPERFLLVERQ